MKPIRSITFLTKTKFLFLLLFAALSSSGTPLTGTYTIGGSGANYASINAAVTALKSNGISGNVRFRISSGTYTEQIRIPAITGSSKSAVITFESLSGKAKDVVVEHQHGGWSTNFNYTLFIDGADYVHFKNITFEALKNTSSSRDYNRVLYVTNNSDHLVFQGNVFKSWRPKSVSFEYNDCVFVGSDYTSSLQNDTITFDSNQFIGGNYGMKMQGSNSAGNYQTSGWYIINNTFTECGSGLYIQIGKNTWIERNKFYSDKDVMLRAIQINQHSDTLSVQGNLIHLKNGYWGIDLSNLVRGSTNYKVISNNSITMGGNVVTTGNIFGVSSQRNSPVLFANNSINITQAVTGLSRCFFSQYDTFTLHNNQLITMGNGYCYYFLNTSKTQVTSSHNNLYSSGKKLLYFGATDYTSLADIKNDHGLEDSSLSLNPLFQTSTIHIPYEVKMFGSGKYLNKVPLDYFGNKRNNPTSMGIFDGIKPSHDAGLDSSKSDNKTLCPNENFTLYANLVNYGNTTLTSATLRYSVNGQVSSGKKWSGKLDPLQKRKDIILGIVKTTKPVVVKLWVEKPNGQNDLANFNDTIHLNLTLAMKGSYSVGAPTSDFPSLQMALLELENRGLCAPVYLNLDSGIHKGQGVIKEYDGASAINKLFIQSANRDSSQTILEFNAVSSVNDFVIHAEDASHVVVRDLSISPIGRSYRKGIVLENSSDIEISNCAFGYAGGPSTGTAITVVGGAFTESNNNLIRNNVVYGFNDQVHLHAYQTNLGKGNVIDSNRFEGLCNRSIVVEDQRDLVISNNQVKGTRFGHQGTFYFKDCGENLNVLANKIVLKGRNPRAITLDKCIASDSSPILVANNFLSVIGTEYNTACEITWTENLKFFHNNILASNLEGTALRVANRIKDASFYNNVLSCPDGGLILQSFYELDTTGMSFDHNAYYSTASQPFEFDRTKYSFTQHKLKYEVDSQTIFTNPFYVSDSNLHINNAVNIKGMGRYLKEVRTDIDGDKRDSLPDIGADEFGIDSTKLRDISIQRILSPDTLSCDRTDSIALRIFNHSTFQIDSFLLKWWLFGVLQDSTIVRVPIKPSDSIDHRVASFKFSRNTLYDLDFEISNPNGDTDFIFENNDDATDYFFLDAIEIGMRKDKCSDETELYVPVGEYHTIKWSDNSTGKRTHVTKSGKYSVTVTGKTGCTVTHEIKVNQ